MSKKPNSRVNPVKKITSSSVHEAYNPTVYTAPRGSPSSTPPGMKPQPGPWNAPPQQQRRQACNGRKSSLDRTGNVSSELAYSATLKERAGANAENKKDHEREAKEKQTHSREVAARSRSSQLHGPAVTSKTSTNRQTLGSPSSVSTNLRKECRSSLRSGNSFGHTVGVNKHQSTSTVQRTPHDVAKEKHMESKIQAAHDTNDTTIAKLRAEVKEKQNELHMVKALMSREMDQERNRIHCEAEKEKSTEVNRVKAEMTREKTKEMDKLKAKLLKEYEVKVKRLKAEMIKSKESELERLAAEMVKKKEKELEVIKAEVFKKKEKDKGMERKARLLRGKERECSIVRAEVVDKKREMEAFKDELMKEKGKEVSRLRAELLKVKDAEICKVRTELTAGHEKEIKQLRMMMTKEKEKEINELRLELLREKEREIDEIKAQMGNHLIHGKERLRAELLKVKDAEICKVRTELTAEHEKEIKQLRARMIKEKENEINELLREKDGEIDKTNHVMSEILRVELLKSGENEIGKVKAELSIEKEREMEMFKAEVMKWNEIEISRLRAKLLKEKDAEISKVRTELSLEHEKEIKQLKVKEKQEKDREIDEIKAQMDIKREREIDRLKIESRVINENQKAELLREKEREIEQLRVQMMKGKDVEKRTSTCTCSDRLKETEPSTTVPCNRNADTLWITTGIRSSVGASSAPRVCGLSNLGNTCYMNAALQCLYSTTAFRNAFLKGEFVAELMNLLQEMTSGKKEAVKPLRLKVLVENSFRGFSGSLQQDSQEFLTALLERLHEELGAKVRNASEESLVSRVFHGELQTTLHCEKCHQITTKCDPLMFLSVSIPSEPSLTHQPKNRAVRIDLRDCLQAFTKEEFFGDNCWFCAKCKEHANLRRKVGVSIPPRVLIVYLKRFDQDAYGVRHKITATVHFQSDLDMTPYMTTNNRTTYSLFAIINHTGIISSGHYTAFCKHGTQWYNFNDAHVTAMNENEIVTSGAYVLFYSSNSCSL